MWKVQSTQARHVNSWVCCNKCKSFSFQGKFIFWENLGQNKPQCIACGIISNNLKNPICNGCIEYYSMFIDSCEIKKTSYCSSETKKEVPISILRILEGGKLFTEDQNRDENQVATWSTLATTILESAYNHQQKASTNRLGIPKTTTNTGLQGLNQFKNLSKAKAIQDERKAKKAEVQLRDVGIRVVATIDRKSVV